MHDALRTAPLPVHPVGQVLMLHGGAQHGHQPVDHRSLALRRTRAMFAAIAPRLTEAGVVVNLLRFSVRGWNADHGDVPPPVADARDAVDALVQAHPDLPIVLLGHSMGARAAVHAADAPQVTGVVGLAPWLPPDDPIAALTGKHLVAAHGQRDRITSPRATRKYVERAAAVAATARFVDMGSLGHYMLTGARRWNEVAVSEAMALLNVGPDVGSVTPPE